MGQHGFARNTDCTVKVDGSKATCTLGHSEATLAAWPYKFELIYTVEILFGGELVTELNVRNIDEKPFIFTALLHTYLRVQDISTASVHGLSGLSFADKLANGEVFKESREVLEVGSEVDRNYINFPHKAVLKHANGQLTLATSPNFPDLVVWNPWIDKAKALADFGDEEYKEMICLEAGKIITPVTLEPNQSWSASQTLSSS